MTYILQGGHAEPTLEYDVTDAATGAPTRITVLTGVVTFAFQSSGFKVVSSLDAVPRTPMGFFVTGMQPLPPGPDPLIVPELSPMNLGVFVADLKCTRAHGVADLHAQLAPNPQAGGQRMVYLSFVCVGNESMDLRYRVTLYRTRH